MFKVFFLNRTLSPEAAKLPLIFRLNVDEDVLGMPRMLFVLAAGCLGVGLVACCAFSISCWQSRKKQDRNYYNFSMLSQQEESSKSKKLFEDDDDDDDEVFRTPIKSEIFFQWYIFILFS